MVFWYFQGEKKLINSLKFAWIRVILVVNFGDDSLILPFYHECFLQSILNSWSKYIE